ncbi:MAG: hypothetical protein ACOXZW_02370 [Bacilli bacterium]|jgi:hypothetical protein|nr:hypothetical protein [Bacilli bacterium]
MEVLLVGAIILFILEYDQIISSNKFIKDNEQYFNILKETDYVFYVRAKHGEDVDVEKLFSLRIRNALVAFVIFIFVFIAQLNFINFIAAIVISYFVYKMQYITLRNHYKRNLHEIDMMLPYYLKSLEILIQHYTAPMALSRSIQTAPPIFKPGLRELIAKIDAGDSSIEPYMAFAKEYPVRDSMRMMRLLYRLGLGAQENKQEQLLMFSRTVSALQNKAREQRYKERLGNMEKRTLIMLVVTGGGTLAILLLSMLMIFQF